MGAGATRAGAAADKAVGAEFLIKNRAAGAGRDEDRCSSEGVVLLLLLSALSALFTLLCKP